MVDQPCSFRWRRAYSIERLIRSSSSFRPSAGLNPVVFVSGVFEVGFGGLKPVPELGKTVDPRSLVGVANSGARLTFVLDVAAFRNYTLDVPLPELPPG